MTAAPVQQKTLAAVDPLVAPAGERIRLSVLSGEPNSIVLVAEDGQALIGYVEASGQTGSP